MGGWEWKSLKVQVKGAIRPDYSSLVSSVSLVRALFPIHSPNSVSHHPDCLSMLLTIKIIVKLKIINDPHIEIIQKDLLAHVYLIKWLYDGGGGLRQLELIRIM